MGDLDCFLSHFQTHQSVGSRPESGPLLSGAALMIPIGIGRLLVRRDGLLGRRSAAPSPPRDARHSPPEAARLVDLQQNERVQDDDGEVGNHLDEQELGPEHVVHHIVGVHAKLGQLLIAKRDEEVLLVIGISNGSYCMMAQLALSPHHVIFLLVVSALEKLWNVVEEGEAYGHGDQQLLPGEAPERVDDGKVPEVKTLIMNFPKTMRDAQFGLSPTSLRKFLSDQIPMDKSEALSSPFLHPDLCTKESSFPHFNILCTKIERRPFDCEVLYFFPRTFWGWI